MSKRSGLKTVSAILLGKSVLTLTKTMSIKLFISYSHNTIAPDYMKQILALSDRLRSDGIDCRIDQYEDSPPEGWPRWMLNQVDRADFVLVACSEEYDRRFRGNEAYGKGKGATWEGGVIIQELYDAQGQNSKFIPITLHPEDFKFIPSPLRGTTYYVLQSDDGYNLLYRHLTDQHETPSPPLGTFKKMPVSDRHQHFTNSSSTMEEGKDRFEAVQKPVALPKNISIRELVAAALSDDDLSNLCQDEFPKVYGQFTTGQTKSHRIRLLIDHAERQRETSKLLDAIARMNPVAYQELIGDEVSDNKIQSNLVQDNTGNAQGFQTAVHGGSVYIGGIHVHSEPTPLQLQPLASTVKTGHESASLSARAEALKSAVNQQIATEIAELKAIGQPIYYSVNGKLIREDADGKTFEYDPLPLSQLKGAQC
jgi:hypothetical protein